MSAMEEDMEIEMLLKSNEKILLEAASTVDDQNENNFNKPDVLELNKNGVLNKSLLVDNEPNNTSENTLDDKKHSIEQSNIAKTQNNEEKNISTYCDEVQELLDYHIVSYMAKDPTKHVLPLHSVDSDEDSSSSEDLNYEDNDESDNFINEIMADNELKYKGRFVEKMQKQIGNKSKHQVQNKSINDLVAVQKLILDRHCLLTRLESRLQHELLENEEKQKQVRDSIVSLNESSSTKAKEPSYTRCFFKKFGMPYFEDSYGFTPPPNEDLKKKIDRGELIVTDIPKIRYWTKIHKEMLTEAIRETLWDENSEKLRKEIVKLKRALGNCSKENDDFINEKIAKCQDELRFLRRKSYLELVSKEPPDREYDWMKYSATVFDGIHSSDECKRFWHVYLKPSINKSSWEVEEDLKLLEIAEQMQYQDWDMIAELLGTNRTAYQCLVHFQTRIHTKHDFSSGKWSKEEDEKLINVINASKIGDFIPWTKVSSHMGNRNHSQIYNRWNNSLNPNLVKGKFTKEEDMLIISGIDVFGATYKEISTLMNNRTPNQIRERYERYLLPRNAKIGTWSLEEDKNLLRLVNKYGAQNWVAVSKELKTRSRTQARQRYSFIQTMMETKPDWTIDKVKRRQVNNSGKDLQKIQIRVEKIKKEIDAVEKKFNLTKLEKDTFRIEKLKEMRDKIMLNNIEIKRKKKVFSDSSEVNNRLLEYFKSSIVTPLVESNKIHETSDYSSRFNEIVSLAKYFGHEIKLPENEEEICFNPRLNLDLKYLLLESVRSKVIEPETDFEERGMTVGCASPLLLDYTAPDTDDTILMYEWWHSPPVDVTRLNFNEFFKRTVFDYSYGMHKDIWSSKMKRTSSSTPATGEPEVQHQPLMIPPNLLNTQGLRSILLSRGRLRKDTTDRGFAANIYKRPQIDESCFKKDEELRHNLFDQFQESMITLFTWPKVLSLTSINVTPLPILTFSDDMIQKSSTKRENKIGSLLNKSDTQSCRIVDNDSSKNEKVKNKRRVKTLLEHKMDCNLKTLEFKKGIRYKRKMQIEHLVQNIKGKPDEPSCPKPPTMRARKRVRKSSQINRLRVSAKIKELGALLNPSTSDHSNQPSTSTGQVKHDDNSFDIKPIPFNVYSNITTYKHKRKRKGNSVHQDTSKQGKFENPNSQQDKRISHHTEDCLEKTPSMLVLV